MLPEIGYYRESIIAAIQIPVVYFYSEPLYNGLCSDECLDIMRYNVDARDKLKMTVKQSEAAKKLLCDILGIEYELIDGSPTLA